MTFGSGSFEAVAALEMAEAALDADPELGEAAVGAFGAGRLATGDEDAFGTGQLLGDADREEAAVECELTRFATASPTAGPLRDPCSTAASAGANPGCGPISVVG
ncbi:hypothetical protein [Capillimicrobium parvum]|uniref:hypothetical protein n=1 Tax=Capillimicrobium parvum TaxID=2884022 RepID=UPI00216B3574|nr:hypothetical protein [Capillimicrobium parvum]